MRLLQLIKLQLSLALALAAFVVSFVLADSKENPSSREKYAPTWDSLDKRPLPGWYDEAKIGIFLHWGVFSVPSFGSEWFWWDWQGARKKPFVDYMTANYRPGFTYPDFADGFRADLYNASDWADLFAAAGARYVVLTSKHHEGFCNWPSKYAWNWNVAERGPKRDLVGELAAAIRSRQPHVHFGLYHSLFEWFNPMYNLDKANQFNTRKFVEEKTLPELYELVAAYKPDVIWSDGDAGPVEYWNSTGFLAWLYNDSPVRDTVVTNDRWGDGTACKHGGYYTCADRYNPGHLLPHKWENCFTIDSKSWGFRRDARISDYLTIESIIGQIVSTVSCGGNVLINIGPRADGMIAPIFEERLRQMGQWLTVNGEAIYGSRAWGRQNDTITPGIWYTASANTTVVYAITLRWPAAGKLYLGSVGAYQARTLVVLVTGNGTGPVLNFTAHAGSGLTVYLPEEFHTSLQWAWAIKMTHVVPV